MRAMQCPTVITMIVVCNDQSSRVKLAPGGRANRKSPAVQHRQTQRKWSPIIMKRRKQVNCIKSPAFRILMLVKSVPSERSMSVNMLPVMQAPSICIKEANRLKETRALAKWFVLNHNSFQLCFSRGVMHQTILSKVMKHEIAMQDGASLFLVSWVNSYVSGVNIQDCYIADKECENVGIIENRESSRDMPNTLH